MAGRITIITGPPGAGKSTVARALAEGAAAPRAVHLHTDDFYAYIRKGYVAPWVAESAAQNQTVAEAQAASASVYARGGYDVYVDGIVGPWFLDPWRQAARGADPRYVVLLPGQAETVARAVARKDHPMRDAGVVQQMHAAFAARPDFAAHWLDTSDLSVDETCAAIRAGIEDAKFRLG